jgi:signal transduction histidine kinase
MLGKVNWLVRGLGFAWLGVLAFAIAPPPGRLAAAVQIVGYALVGLSLLAWAMVEASGAGMRELPSRYAVILAVMAVAAGSASTAGGGGVALVSFALVAAMVAGAELSAAAAAIVTATGILAVELGALAFGGSYGAFLGLPAFLLGGLIIGRNRGAYRIQAEQATMLLAQRERLQTEQRRADLLYERARIAREIHDVLAHSLGALGIQIQAARAVLADYCDIAKAGELLATAQHLTNEGLEETRRAVQALRTDPRSLDEELAQISTTYAQRFRVAIDFRTSGVPRPVAPDAALALVRVAQEALVNAAKHATGERIAISLEYTDDGTRLTVRNPLSRAGAGRPALRTLDSGYGLPGMRERLRLLNGTLVAEPGADEWLVTAEVPHHDDWTITA